jgi:parallel beta-helix repeat protein
LKRFRNKLGNKLAKKFLKESEIGNNKRHTEAGVEVQPLTTISIESNRSVPVKMLSTHSSNQNNIIKPISQNNNMIDIDTISNPMTTNRSKKTFMNTEISKETGNTKMAVYNNSSTNTESSNSMRSAIMNKLRAFFKNNWGKKNEKINNKKKKKTFLEDGEKSSSNNSKKTNGKSSKTESRTQTKSWNSEKFYFPLEEKLLALEIYKKKTILAAELDIETIVSEKESLGLSQKSECLIYLKKGSLYLVKCFLSMNMHLRVTTSSPASVYLSPGTKSVISDCEIRGGNLYKTVGLLSHLASLSINNCKFFEHKIAGLKLILDNKSFVSVNFSQFERNTCGISVMGNSVKSELHDNKIFGNHIGVKIALESRILLSSSHISNNKYGVLIVSADPVIKDNKISFNQLHGLISVASDKLLNQSRIEGNEISYNHKFGIRISGYKNHSFLMDNTITFNKKGGISIKNEANAKLLGNKILNNLGIGVLIHKKSSCHVERNIIKHSVKANIALCDLNTFFKTTLINNIISHSRCEGVILLDCSNFLIS